MCSFNEDLFSVIFVLGKKMYKIVNPTGNLIVKVTKCVCVSHVSNNFKHFENSKTDKNLLSTDHANHVYITERNNLFSKIKKKLKN